MNGTQTTSVKIAVENGLAAMFRPVPITAAEWADENFYLSAESTYIQGRWETLPFQKAILNSMGNDQIRTVNLMKSARCGYSQMIKAAIGYFLEHKKRNQLLFQPTNSAAAHFMKTHIEGMIRDVPVVRSLAPWYGKRHRNNTTNAKQFSNQRQLLVRGGESAANYREVSTCCVYYDELSSFPSSVEMEGNATMLGDRRTQGSSFPKSIRGSTPKISGTCQIEMAANECEADFRFYVPCPHCGELQYLKFGGEKSDCGLKWVNDDPKTAAYLCEHCQCIFENSCVMEIQERGIWRCDKTGLETTDGILFTKDGEEVETPESVTYRIWAAYSPFTTWKVIAQDFLKCKGDSDKLQAFVNLTLGECWVIDGVQLEPNEIMRRRQEYNCDVPKPVFTLTAGADVQSDRIEVLVMGWAANEECYNVDFKIIYGDPKSPLIWRELDNYLQTPFKHESGKEMRVRTAFIDSGYLGDEVRKFTKPREYRGVFACRGASTTRDLFDNRPSVNNANRAKTYYIGTDAGKDQVFQQLQVPQYGPGFVHYPLTSVFDEEFFNQLTAERAVIKYRNGQAVRVYETTRKRNEALDITVYNFAAYRHFVANYINPNNLKRADNEGE